MSVDPVPDAAPANLDAIYALHDAQRAASPDDVPGQPHRTRGYFGYEVDNEEANRRLCQYYVTLHQHRFEQPANSSVSHPTHPPLLLSVASTHVSARPLQHKRGTSIRKLS
jgi:hypothetical protein